MTDHADKPERIDARLAADPNRRLTMTRRFAASAERVFDAWTDPERMNRWLFTGPASERHTSEVDLRVGGRWTITDRRDGKDYTALGVYLEVDRPRRLAFTFGMPQFSPEFDRVIVEIVPDGDGCIMTMMQEGIEVAHKDATEEGWRLMFDGLAAAIA